MSGQPPGLRQTSEPSDGTLLTDIGRGNLDAFATLYDRHAGYVLALSIRVLRERQDAEDVVQEVFWQLWTGQSRYDPVRGRFTTWLFTVARNRSIDRLRRRGRAGQGDGDALPEASMDNDPEIDASQAERRRMVSDALEQLSTNQRQAVELCFFQGLSHREASDRLQSPLGTVKSRIRSALMTLERLLEPLKE